MSLTDILKFRYPLVWVNTQESERLIVNLATIIDDRELYVFDDFDGLTIWDEETLDFKIVIVEVFDNRIGEMVDMPLMDFGEAFGYVFDRADQAVFVIRNFHKEAEKYYNSLASIYNKYYRTLRFDDMESCPLTVLCLSTEPEVPAEIAAICAIDNFELPTESALVELLTYLSTKMPKDDAIPNDRVTDLSKACRGMAEFDVINTVFSLIKKDGTVRSEEIERIKYERLKASSTLDIIKPQWGLDEVGGMDYAKKVILKAKWIREHSEQAATKGVKPINKFLFLGVPGTGKSYIAQAGAKALGTDLAKFGVSQAMEKWVGKSEENMRNAFRQIHALAPITVWIDELGRDFQSGNNDSGTTERVHGELLTGLQELPDTVSLFAAANDISQVPPEMLRAERFDKILFVGYPSFNERIEIFKLNLVKDLDYDWEQIANRTNFFTGAEIVQLLNDVKFECLENEGPITTKDILAGIPRLKNRLWITHKYLIQSMYANAIEKYEWASTEQREEARSIVEGKAYSQERSNVTSGMKIKS